MKTILELSQEIGVSKVAINKKIQKLGLKNKLAKNGNMFLIDANQEKIIKQAFNYSDDNQNGNPGDESYRINENQVSTLITMLQGQLEEKDRQIERLQTIINQEQTLRMVTEKKLLALEQKENEPRQGFFSRLFKPGSRREQDLNQDEPGTTEHEQ